MTEYNSSINIGAPSPLIHDFIFGTTYVGFDEYKKRYIEANGQVGANMQIIHKEIGPKTFENYIKNSTLEKSPLMNIVFNRIGSPKWKKYSKLKNLMQSDATEALLGILDKLEDSIKKINDYSRRI